VRACLPPAPPFGQSVPAAKPAITPGVPVSKPTTAARIVGPGALRRLQLGGVCDVGAPPGGSLGGCVVGQPRRAPRWRGPSTRMVVCPDGKMPDRPNDGTHAGGAYLRHPRQHDSYVRCRERHCRRPPGDSFRHRRTTPGVPPKSQRGADDYLLGMIPAPLDRPTLVIAGVTVPPRRRPCDGRGGHCHRPGVGAAAIRHGGPDYHLAATPFTDPLPRIARR